jgi:plasmid stabilization system protein ParE
MRRQLVVRPEAAADAMKASHWYDERVGGLGVRFLDNIEAVMVSISEAPQQFPIYNGEIRRARLGTFPYAVFFTVTDNRVIVLAILHLYREPRVLRKTLRRR